MRFNVANTGVTPGLTVEPRPAPDEVSSPHVFRGRLERLAAGEVLDALIARRATGTLRVGEVLEAQLRVEEGRLIDVRWGERVGADALARLLKLREGGFSFEAGPKHGPHDPGTRAVGGIPHPFRRPPARLSSWATTHAGRPLAMAQAVLAVIALTGAMAVLYDRIPRLIRDPGRPQQSEIVRALVEGNARTRSRIQTLERMTSELSRSMVSPPAAAASAAPPPTELPTARAPEPVEPASASPVTARASVTSARIGAPVGEAVVENAAVENAVVENAVEEEAPVLRTSSLAGTRLIDAGLSGLQMILPWSASGAVAEGEHPAATLRLRVGASGRIEDARVGRSSGDPELDSLALTALRRAIYTPARRGAAAVPASLDQRITFNSE